MELPVYSTVDDFVKGFEDFVGDVYEKCFLVSEGLLRGLRSICSVCLVFTEFVDKQLHWE